MVQNGRTEHEVLIEEVTSMTEVRIRAEGTGAAKLPNRLCEVFSLRIPVEETPAGTPERFEIKSKR